MRLAMYSGPALPTRAPGRQGWTGTVKRSAKQHFIVLSDTNAALLPEGCPGDPCANVKALRVPECRVR